MMIAVIGWLLHSLLVVRAGLLAIAITDWPVPRGVWSRGLASANASRFTDQSSLDCEWLPQLAWSSLPFGSIPES